MIPISKISVGDQFEDPNIPYGCTFIVEELDLTEKMVKFQAYSNVLKTVEHKLIGKPFWKKNTDRMISESWRALCMRK